MGDERENLQGSERSFCDLGVDVEKGHDTINSDTGRE